jgi:trigger factor
MVINKNDLGKGKFELTVELPAEELKAFLERAVEAISVSVKIEGFRPGKATYEIVKQKVGEQAIWEEASRLAINKHLDKLLIDNLPRQAIGQPQVDIVKLAPGNPLEFKVVVALLPQIDLGAYKDFGLVLPDLAVEESEVLKLETELRETRVKESISEEPVSMADKAVLDIQMYLDKVPVEDGQGKSVAVVMGKHYIVPGFDEKIKGLARGESREFSLHYPESHYQKNLAGKMVEFKVKAVEIYKRELPVVDDEFAQSFGLKNAIELKETLKDNLAKEKQEKQDNKLEIEMLDRLTAGAKFGDIPEELVQSELHSMLHEFEHQLEHQGGNLNDYFSSIGKSKDQWLLEASPEAMRRVKTILAMREVGIVEGIRANDKEVEEELAKILERYKGDQQVVSKVKTVEYRNYLFNALSNQKIVSELKKWNIKAK